MLYLQGEAGEGGKDSANFSSSLHEALHTQTHLTSIIAVTVRMERMLIHNKKGQSDRQKETQQRTEGEKDK